MKKMILLLFLVFISKTAFCQQFEKIWECPKKLLYVGDIDGDGIGDLAYEDYNNDKIEFYDITSQNSKWSLTDKRFFYEIYDAEKSNLQPSYIKFPFIDFNGDGKKEMILKKGDGKGLFIYDVVNNSAVFEWTESQLYSVKFIALTDVNGDGKLELIFLARLGEFGDSYKTYIYSTSALTSSVKISQDDIPNNYKLSQNYPNPFNPSTTIEYEISQPENVKINIYDVTGRLIKELVKEQKNIGRYSVVWNGKDDSGNMVASGNYFYQIIIGDFAHAKKMILLK
ncbi:MAG: T9SS type A sorting domain-containing protein [Actinobacteria bacterium]|nr:T9SS type A sorting domain-containing protein [Actinomycetota bacterium]